MVRFLQDLIAIPSESCEEKQVVERIRQEMVKVDAFDRIWTDKMGNLFGQVGRRSRGKKLIAIDAHVDTVGIGNIDEWSRHPYGGVIENGKVWGRGAGDQEGAVPAMVYAARIMRDLKVDTSRYCLLLTFTVMEEDCDGLCWQYIINEDGIRPDAVVITDSTNCKILRGHRGRMEIKVTCKGRSCHGSMPHKGDNAVYKITKIVREIERLNNRLRTDPFLGQGTITVTHITSTAPSLCAVPGFASIHLDRRLTTGETKISALEEVKRTINKTGVKARVFVDQYARPSYTGLVYETEKYFPTWCASADSKQVQAAACTYRKIFRRSPKIGSWTFSTNAVAIAGMHDIPCVGFGPACEDVAHTVRDNVPINHLVQSATFYSMYGNDYCDMQ